MNSTGQIASLGRAPIYHHPQPRCPNYHRAGSYRGHRQQTVPERSCLPNDQCCPLTARKAVAPAGTLSSSFLSFPFSFASLLSASKHSHRLCARQLLVAAAPLATSRCSVAHRPLPAPKPRPRTAGVAGGCVHAGPCGSSGRRTHCRIGGQEQVRPAAALRPSCCLAPSCPRLQPTVRSRSRYKGASARLGPRLPNSHQVHPDRPAATATHHTGR